MQFLNDADLNLSRIGRLLKRREISSVELTRFFLDRIYKYQPALNAFITITEDLALRQASRCEDEIRKGQYRGPLHGIPISLKDLFYTQGVRTTAGSRILRNFVPRENAAVVNRLYAAGAILLGKTNMHEFAYGATNVNIHYGSVRNPWDTSRMSGGSSGGSAAAVVAALSLASLGTDTGGSIRIPSAACGCVGLKPTYGRVSLRGVIPLATSLDHVGPLTRCVQDAGIMLDVIADGEHDAAGRLPQRRARSFARDLTHDIQGLRIGVPRHYFFERIQRDVRRKISAAISVLKSVGARVREVDLPRMQETGKLASILTVGEALAYHAQWLKKNPQDYGEDIRSRLEAHRMQTTVEYLQAQARCEAYGERLTGAFRTVDLLVAPTIPCVAPLIEDLAVSVGRGREDVRQALLRLTRPASLAGLPAISLPCGFSDEGLPVGLQLIGRQWEEATVLRAAYSFEQATECHKVFPSLDMG